MAASLLSQQHRVCLIERGPLGRTAKCWVTTVRRLQKHGLDQCVLATPPTMSVGTFLGGRISVRGDFAVVDDRRALHVLIDRCKATGVHFIENCALLNLSWQERRLMADTTKGALNARLIVDATGGLSPVASTFQLHRIDGFYSIYGARLQGIKLRQSEIVLGFVSQLGNPPPVLEVFPTGDDSAYCVLFIYAKTLLPPEALADSFDRHCQQNPFFELTETSIRSDEKAGVIPIGRRRRRLLRGVVSFGEAGLIQPPLMGTAFNELLEHAETLCHQVSDTMRGATAQPGYVRLAYPLRKRAQDQIQRPLVRTLLAGNVERLDHILRVMNRFPEPVLFNFFSNELTWSQVAQLALQLPWHFAVAGTKEILRPAR